MGETILDRRKHTCKGPEGDMMHSSSRKEACVARAQSAREKGGSGDGGGDGVGG